MIQTTANTPLPPFFKGGGEAGHTQCIVLNKIKCFCPVISATSVVKCNPLKPTSEGKMIEENPSENQEPREAARPLTGTEKKILAVAGIILLAGVSFMAGRFTATSSPQPAANPFAAQTQALPSQPALPTTVSQLQLNMIDFSGVSQAKIAAVLEAFNAKKCACGCNMNVAECIIKDPNCPMWKDHVTQIQTALGNGKKPDLSKGGNPLMNFPAKFPNNTLPGPKMVPPPSKP